ncbi:MAG: WD40 repeat domain-containing protein [Anaerolineales bacterium]|nr:WD40 repeat domain-containing protein [Anaerolineales bacterium]
MEIDALLQLKGEYLEKAKAAILDGLEKNQGFRPIYSAKALSFVEAVPIMQKWLQKIKNVPAASNGSKTYQLLAFTIYEITKDEAYIPDLIEAVKKAGYGDMDESVSTLGKVPLTLEGISAVWQRYKQGKVTRDTDNWLDQCASFMREKIKHPIGESFLNSLSEEDQKELLKLSNESRKDRIERNLRLDKYIKGRDRYNKEDLNRYDEYIKVGGSPVKGLKLRSIWKGHTNKINSLAWSSNGRYLASTSSDESIMVWDVAQDECTTLLLREKKSSSSTYQPKRVVWLGDEKLACTYDYSSTTDEDVNGVAIWDIQSEKLISPLQKRVKEEKSYVRNLIYSPVNGSLIVSYYGHEDNAVFLLNLATNARERILEEYNGSFENMEISPDGKVIGAGYQESAKAEEDSHEIIFIDLNTMKIINRLQGHLGHINQLRWKSGHPVLASASSDNTIGIWDIEHNQRLAHLEGHRGVVSNIVWSAGGELLASKSSEDRTIQIWNTRTWEVLFILRELDGYADNIAFHPTLPILASIYKDETQEKALRHDVNSIRIWEFDYKEFLDNPPFMNGL